MTVDCPISSDEVGAKMYNWLKWREIVECNLCRGCLEFSHDLQAALIEPLLFLCLKRSYFFRVRAHVSVNLFLSLNMTIVGSLKLVNGTLNFG